MNEGARVGRDGRVVLASEDREAETLAKARKQAREVARQEVRAALDRKLHYSGEAACAD